MQHSPTTEGRDTAPIGMKNRMQRFNLGSPSGEFPGKTAKVTGFKRLFPPLQQSTGLQCKV